VKHELVSITEAAAIVGRSSRTLRLWADQGRLTVYRGPGNRRYFLREEVEALRPRREGDVR
jgi:excisionase family DNA binding protein